MENRKKKFELQNTYKTASPQDYMFFKI